MAEAIEKVGEVVVEGRQAVAQMAMGLAVGKLVQVVVWVLLEV